MHKSSSNSPSQAEQVQMVGIAYKGEAHELGHVVSFSYMDQHQMDGFCAHDTEEFFGLDLRIDIA